MFKLFKRPSEAERLQKKYEKLMKEWHALSTTNRGESDKKFAEAQQVQDQIVILQDK